MNKKWKGSISEISENLSEVIGKTYGGLTILEVIDSFDGKEIKRTCKCQCSCGNITYRKFPEALYGSYRKKYCCPQKKSALKTARKEQHFVISAKRGNRYFKARATSLDEAKLLKNEKSY